MKKLLITLSILFISLGLQAQISPIAKVNKDVSTKDTIIKNVPYKLYIGAKGGRYILVVSKTTGKEYKRYFKG